MATEHDVMIPVSLEDILMDAALDLALHTAANVRGGDDGELTDEEHEAFQQILDAAERCKAEHCPAEPR